MAADGTAFAIVTIFWGIVGIIAPIAVNFTKNANKGVTQVVLAITGASCYLFWLLTYLHQMNPILGVVLHNTTIIAMMYLWDGTYSPESIAMPHEYNATLVEH